MNVTTTRALALMGCIARLEFSYFDEGLEVGSGIWRDALRDELPLPRAIATRTITYCIKQGWLDHDSASTEDGGWVALTDNGLKLINLREEWPTFDSPEEPPASHDTAPQSWSSHAQCKHEKTSKARAACRKARSN